MGDATVQRWRMLASILFAFGKISPMTFGGGFAMVPLIEKEVIVRRSWLKSEELTDVLAVSQSVPGAVAINSAMFIGYRLAGIPGAVAAMAGVLLPTLIIVLALAVAFTQYRNLPLVNAAFEGIRPAIVAIICYAGYRVSKSAVTDKTTLGILLGSIGALLFVNVHPALVIIGGFLLGVAIVSIRDRMGFKTRLEDRPLPAKEDDWGGFMMGDGI
jgi:chromate transporter